MDTGKWKIPFLIILSVACYAYTAGHSFTLDDGVRIYQNRLVHSGEVSKIISTPSWPGNLYRPLTTSVISFVFWQFEQSPVAFHVLNILLYSVLSVLVFVFLRQLFEAGTAFLAACLYAVHPIHVEVVANAAHISELLSGLGIMLLCSLFVSASLQEQMPRVKLMVYTFLSSFLAFYSKESGISVLFILPLIAVYLYRQKNELQLSSLFPFILAMAITLTGYLFHRTGALGGLPLFSDISTVNRIEHITNPLSVLGFSERLLPAISILGKYFFIMLLPWPLSSDYSFPQMTTAVLWQYLFLFALLMLLSVISFIKKNDYWFALLWIYAALFLVSNIPTAIGTIFAERLLLIPSIGFSLLSAQLLCLLKNIKLRQGLIALIAVAYSCLTVYQSTFWKDNISLFSRNVEVSPDSSKAQGAYGMLFIQYGRVDKAIEHLKRVKDLCPDYFHAYYNLGLAYGTKGDAKQCEYWFKKALKINPNSRQAHKKLEQVYNATNRAELARQHRMTAKNLYFDNLEKRINRPLPMIKWILEKTPVGRVFPEASD